VAGNKIIFIVGMHRAHTSLVTSVIASAFGGFVSDPKHRLHPSSQNRPGFFESKRVFRLNEQIFNDAGLSWRTIRSHPAVSIQHKAQIADVLGTDYSPHPVSVVKDPRLCLMIPYWYSEACKIYSPDRIFTLLVVRHPIQVAHSLGCAHSVSFNEAIEIWQAYYAAALHFLKRFDPLAARERRRFWAAIDTSRFDKDHYKAIIKRVRTSLGLPMVGKHPLRRYRPEEKHFTSSQLDEGEVQPTADLERALVLYGKLSEAAKRHTDSFCASTILGA